MHIISITKWKLLTIAMLPFTAGLFLWFAISAVIEKWRQAHPLSRTIPRRSEAQVRFDWLAMFSVIALWLALHLWQWWLRRRIQREPEYISLGRTAWLLLFTGCYLIGGVLGAIFVR